MPKQPSPPQPRSVSSWDIYLAASKAKWIGSIEAEDADAAIKAAAIEFKTDPWRLIAVSRR
jgi:hypothetical protein